MVKNIFFCPQVFPNDLLIPNPIVAPFPMSTPNQSDDVGNARDDVLHWQAWLQLPLENEDFLKNLAFLKFVIRLI